jgi:hypothetical protein
MWGSKPLQIDQLYFLFLEVTRLLVRDDLLALKVTALVAYALRPATTFVLARKLFNSDLAATGAALLSGFYPLFYEALGWGGYPNLLGFVFLPLAFYAILRWIEKKSIKNIVFLGLVTAVTVLSHDLTLIVFSGVLILWLLLAFLSKAWGSKHALDQLLAVGFCLGIILLIEAVQLYATGLPSFDLFNKAAFYQLRVTLGDLAWAAKNPVVAAYFVLVTAVSLVAIHFTRRDGVRMMALVSWMAAPLLMSQVGLFGVSLDYRRVFFFFLQPGLIVVAWPLAFSTILPKDLRQLFATPRGPSLPKYFRRAAASLPRIVLVLLSVSLLVVQVGIGIPFPSVIHSWYNYIDPYGDSEKLQALDWISHSTQDRDIFVADEAFGRWIEGLASRRVVMYAAPQFLFMKGEVERSTAARTILESRFEIRNDLARICYQAPYGHFAPMISFVNEGVYEDVLYASDMDSRVYISNATHSWFEQLSKFAENNSERSYSISGGGESGVLQARFVIGSIGLSEQIVLNDSGIVALQYDLSTSDSSLRFSNITIPLLSPEGIPFDEVYAEGANMIHARSGPIRFSVAVTGETLGARLVASDGSNMIVLSFAPQSSGQSISAKITISADAQKKTSEVLAVDRDDVIRAYNVSYIAIPRLSEPQVNGTVPLRPRSIPAYDHLLSDPAFEIAYENSRVIILRIVSLDLK